VLAVNAGAVAIPLLPVATDALTFPPANMPLGPLDGAVKTMAVPGTALPNASLTFALRESLPPKPSVRLRCKWKRY
jgi:hypothetical protein